MVRRLFTRLLIGPGDLAPAQSGFEVVGVFNPGVVRTETGVVMLLRVAERPIPARRGFVDLPRWRDGAVMVDRFPESEVEALDPRVVRIRASGLVRLTSISHLRLARSRDGVAIDSVSGPVIVPDDDLAEYGMEDPRITLLEGRYQVTCVSVSRHGAATMLLTTDDFDSYERRGVILCPENKDVALFPERVGGQYVALHRPNGATPFTRPEMWIARSRDLRAWGGHTPLRLGAGADWASGRVGGGAPPLRTPEGWLEIYHGNRRPAAAGEIGAYYGAAVVLDAENPAIARQLAGEPILSPSEPFERQGFAGGVVFPTGVVDRDDELLVYYGAADTCTAVAALSRSELMAEMHTIAV